MRKTPSGSRLPPVDRRALDHAPVRGEVPAPGSRPSRSCPFARARSGGQITSSGSTPSCSWSRARSRAGRSLSSHSSRMSSHVRPSTVRAPEFSEAEPPEVEHHLGHAAGEEDADGRVVLGPFGSASTSRGTARLTRRQSSAVGRARPGRVRDRGDVDQEVRRAAERGVGEHRVLERLRREHVGERPTLAPLRVDRLRGAAGDVEPDRLARRCERRVRHGQPEAPPRRPARSRRCRGTDSRRPGLAHARQPRSAASSSDTSPWAKRAPSV